MGTWLGGWDKYRRGPPKLIKLRVAEYYRATFTFKGKNVLYLIGKRFFGWRLPLLFATECGPFRFYVRPRISHGKGGVLIMFQISCLQLLPYILREPRIDPRAKSDGALTVATKQAVRNFILRCKDFRIEQLHQARPYLFPEDVAAQCFRLKR